MKQYNSRSVAKAMINKMYTEKEMHDAADPSSKASQRYDEVLKLIKRKDGYEKIGFVVVNLGGGRMLRRKVLHESESNIGSERDAEIRE